MALRIQPCTSSQRSCASESQTKDIGCLNRVMDCKELTAAEIRRAKRETDAQWVNRRTPYVCNSLVHCNLLQFPVVGTHPPLPYLVPDSSLGLLTVDFDLTLICIFNTGVNTQC